MERDPKFIFHLVMRMYPTEGQYHTAWYCIYKKHKNIYLLHTTKEELLLMYTHDGKPKQTETRRHWLQQYLIRIVTSFFAGGGAKWLQRYLTTEHVFENFGGGNVIIIRKYYQITRWV